MPIQQFVPPSHELILQKLEVTLHSLSGLATLADFSTVAHVDVENRTAAEAEIRVAIQAVLNAKVRLSSRR